MLNTPFSPWPSFTQEEADAVRDVLLGHLDHLYEFYGELSGLRIARKHIGWYCQDRPDSRAFWLRVSRVESADEQRALVAAFFGQQLVTTAIAA